jgi:hypothetical protein
MSACGTEQGKDSGKEPRMDDRPSMESTIESYERMRDAMFAALEAELGPREWRVSPTNDHLGRAGCAEDPDGETAFLPSYLFTGTYERADWKEAAQIVETVGREHGFDDTATVVDRPGDFELVGEDEYGGRYEFGMAKNTTLGQRTGCHRWDKKPPPSP